MSEMIERVARAMYLNRVAPDSGPVVLSVASMGWEVLLEEHSPGHQVWHCKGFWRQAARAAIEAMREPTEEMIDAADATGKGGGISDHGGVEPTTYDLDEVWEAMIDAALSEKP